MQRPAVGMGRWLLLSDLHFRHHDLDRVRLTAQWIVEQAERYGVQRAVICGDLLTSRTMQLTHVLSACYRFVGALSDTVPHVHVLLGNHDMAYRRDYRTTALDALGLRRMAPFVSLYAEVARGEWDGRPVLLLPFREDQAELTAAVDALHPAEAGGTVAFAHLALNRAITQRHVVRHTAASAASPSPITHRGLTGPDRFASLARTFTGHFHSHQVMSPKRKDDQHGGERAAAGHDPLQGSVVYLGSPLQLTWSDLHDERRGVLLLDPDTLEHEMLVNPHAVGYTTAQVHDVLDGTVDATAVAGKHVMLLGKLTRLKYVSARDKLLSLGVRGVRDWTPTGLLVRDDYRSVGGLGASVPACDIPVSYLPLGKSVEDDRSHAVEPGKGCTSALTTAETEPEPQQLDLEAEAREYVDSLVLDESLAPRRDELVRVGQRAIRFAGKIESGGDDLNITYTDFMDGSLVDAAAQIPTGLADAPPRSVFVAEPQSLTISNFLGVQGTLTISFTDDLSRGLTFLVGENGSGKSTIVDAMVWCQFGRCIRSGMAANDVVNDSAGRNCSVSLAFANGYTISRHRRDKTNGNRVIVSLHGEPQTHMEHPDARTTQAAIDELLGIDFETYVRTVVLGHESAASFLSSTPTQRRDLIEASLGLSVLDQCGNVSRLALRDIDDDVAKTETKRDGQSYTMSYIEGRLEDRDSGRDSLVQQAQADTKTLAEAMERLESRTREATEAAEKMPKLSESIEELDKRIGTSSEDIQVLMQQVRAAELCIAFYAQTTSLQIQVHGEQKRLSQLQDIYARLQAEKKTLKKTGFGRMRQRIAQRLEAMAFAPEPKRTRLPIYLAKAFALRLQLVAIRILSRIFDPLRRGGDQDARVEHLQKETTDMWLHVEDSTSRLAMLRAYAEPAAVETAVAAEHNVDVQDVRDVVSAMTPDLAKGMNIQLADAIRAQGALQNERDLLREQRQARERAWREREEAQREEERTCERLRQQLVAQKREVSTYERLIDEERAELAQVRAQHHELGGRLDRLAADRELFAFWVSALAKRSRSRQVAAADSTAMTFRDFVLEKPLVELNRLLAQILTVLYEDTRHARAMTTGILRSIFAYEEEEGDSTDSNSPTSTTTTTTATAMAPAILNRTLGVDASLAYGKRSGGERKRVDLALFFALQQAIGRARATHRARYVLVDEVFDSLDEAGQAAVVRWCAAFMAADWTVVITHSRFLVERQQQQQQAGNNHDDDGGEGAASFVVVRARMGENGTELLIDGRALPLQGVPAAGQGGDAGTSGVRKSRKNARPDRRSHTLL